MCVFNLSFLEKDFLQWTQLNTNPPWALALCLDKCLVWVNIFPHWGQATLFVFAFTWISSWTSRPCSLSLSFLENTFSHFSHVNLNAWHSGGEWSLGETKYIIGDSYTVAKVWATTFGINWRKKWPLGAFWENAEIAFFAPKNYFWGKNKALVWLYLQSWTWFDVIIILGIKFWWFSFFLDPLLLI